MGGTEEIHRDSYFVFLAYPDYSRKVELDRFLLICTFLANAFYDKSISVADAEGRSS
jgi:hypothetical protein